MKRGLCEGSSIGGPPMGPGGRPKGMKGLGMPPGPNRCGSIIGASMKPPRLLPVVTQTTGRWASG